jgi:two-component system, chemotaxis family, chemotaxis protein CheY
MSVRVLIVDDSVMVRDELRHHLECMGCVVVAEAANTVQALTLFRTVSPSLAIVDIAVPQTGGIGALALLRIMRREDPTVRVVMLGSLPLPEVRKSFLREGAVDFLIKPSLLNGFECMRKRLEELFPELKRVAQTPNAHPESETDPEHRPIVGH